MNSPRFTPAAVTGLRTVTATVMPSIALGSLSVKVENGVAIAVSSMLMLLLLPMSIRGVSPASMWLADPVRVALPMALFT